MKKEKERKKERKMKKEKVESSSTTIDYNWPQHHLIHSRVCAPNINRIELPASQVEAESALWKNNAFRHSSKTVKEKEKEQPKEMIQNFIWKKSLKEYERRMKDSFKPEGNEGRKEGRKVFEEKKEQKEARIDPLFEFKISQKKGK